ncbi:dermonecrotic toxin domain-containing protein [Pseudomonas sp. B22129]|uniref:dermonecrotic toxin domain-containing protein n=1 Tax=Pseudomonas sp. B22129 TaxID=3235111 RepID=UPI003783C1FE
MHYESAASTPLLDTLNTRDSLLKSRLTSQISTLNDEVLDKLKQQPTFSRFVQQAFDQAFTALPAPLDLNAIFINAHTLAQQPDAHAPKPLLPTLMDAVAARIVRGKLITYATGAVSFHRTLGAESSIEAVTGITGVAFEAFLDTLANNLEARFKAYLDDYWNGPIGPTDVRSHKDWVAEKHLEIMKTEVALLKADGVLETSDELLLMQVARRPDALSRATLAGYRPCAYGLAVKDPLSTDIPLYGAFLITSRDQDDAQVRQEGERPALQVRAITPGANVGKVLLFLPGSGFEAFDSLASLDRELHRRLNSPGEFPGIVRLMEEKDRASGLAFHQQQIESDQFRYIERLESIFSDCIDSIYRQVHAQFTWMVGHYQRQNEDVDSTQLPASLDRVTDLARAFDASGVLAARHHKQIQLQLKQFLKEASSTDKLAWEAAVREYSNQLIELNAPSGLPSLSQYSDPGTLLAYSNEQLANALEAEYALTVNPDDIIVHTKSYVVRQAGAYVVGGKPHPSEPGARLFDARKRTLTELALENVEWLDLNFINFSRLTDTEQAPFTALSTAQVKDLVRKVNIGDSYERFLKARLVTSDAAKSEQQRYTQVMALQLRVDALEAKIAGDFLPDRLNRGFNWVMTVLAGPTDDDKRGKVEEHRIIVSCLKLRGERVRGVLVFTTAAHSVASMVVYTPQASGGRVFHEYADASAMRRDFINHSAWREYLIERTALSARARIRSVLSGGAQELVIALTRIADNFLEEAYRVEASTVINDANAQSTSTQEANFESSTTLLTAALDLATMFLPVKIMLPIGLARSILSVINAVEAAQVGDRATAAQSIVRAFGELVGAVIDGAVGVGSARAAATLRPTSQGLDPKLSLATKPDGITSLAGWEAHHIYVRDVVEPNTFQAPLHFLLDKGRWYSIRRDSDTQVWRLKDPRRAPSAYKGDPLFRDSQGLWGIRSPGLSGEGLGLLGGAPTPTAAERALMDLFPYLDTQQVRQVFSLFVFPYGRVHELEMSLVHRLRTSLRLPDEYHQYLMATPGQFDTLIRGRRLSSTLTPSPVEPSAGPSRQIQGPAPSPSAAPTEQRFLDWGQTLDLSTHRTVQERPQFWHRSTPQSGPNAPEYIQIGEQHYATLPGGSAETGAVIVPNNRRYSTFREFEDLLHYNLYDQPRLGVYSPSLNRWLISLVTYQRPLIRYIEAAFPFFASRSTRQIAEALFANTNPAGLTTDGYLRLLNTISDWRSWLSMPSFTASDPLMLLSRHPVTPRYNFWTLNHGHTEFSLLELSTSRVAGNLAAQAFQQQNDVTTRALMSNLLRGSGYEVFELAAQDHFLFRRRGHSIVYWLSLRRTPSNTLAYRNYIEPGPQRNSFQNLPPTIRAMASQAHANGDFVPLIGVLRINRRAGVVTPFIFRP